MQLFDFLNKLDLTEKDNNTFFYIKVIPGSSANKICGVENSILKIKVTAVPEKGLANKAVIELLSEKLKIAKKYIEITEGLTSRKKKIKVQNLSGDRITNILGI